MEQKYRNHPMIKILIITIGIGLVAHAYCYFSTPFVHDALTIHQGDDNLWKIGLGRFMYPIYMLIRGDIVIPWLIGLLSLVFIGLANYCIITLFQIKDSIRQILVCGVFTVNLTVILLNAAYIHDVDWDMFAFFCSVYAVYLLERYRKWGQWLAIPLIVIMLGTYPAFLQVTLTIGCILLIQKVLNGSSHKELGSLIGKAIVTLIGSFFLYYAINYATLVAYGMQDFTSGNSSMAVLGYDYTGLFDYIERMIAHLGVYYFKPIAISVTGVGICNGMICILIILGLLAKIRKNQLDGKSILMLIGLLVILPLTMGFMCIVAEGHFHDLMKTSFNCLYLLLILLFPDGFMDGNSEGNSCKISCVYAPRAVAILIGIIVWNNIIMANQIYVTTQLKYDTTLSTMTRVIDRMEQTEGYVMGETPVITVGSLAMYDSEFYQVREGFETLTRGTGQSYTMSTTVRGMYEWYFDYVLAYPINYICEDEGHAELLDTYLTMEAVRALPNFPDAGSVVMIDGVLIVKLSSEDIEGNYNWTVDI